MKWQGRRGSRNIEDRRGMRMGGGGGAGIGGFGLLAVLAIGYFLGIDVTPLLNGQMGGTDEIVQSDVPLTEADRQAGQFVSVTLADTEDVWADNFRQLGRTYQPATLVLFKQVTPSPCGNASGATGPFYCPIDKKVYLDTDFFTTMSQRMGAGGDFAAAYVVAHEVAHHVQDELGILEKVNSVRQRSSQAVSNDLSVRIELQADCFSGIWARQAAETFGTIDRQDLLEAINAAKQIGDDTLMRNAGRIPTPEAFTHGTSQQRQRWLVRGMEAGQIEACDTFGTDQL